MKNTSTKNPPRSGSTRSSGSARSNNTRSANTSQSAARKKPAPRSAAKTPVKAARPIRREVWSGVCLFLAIFAILGVCGVNALFINLFRGLSQGLFGWGSVLLPFLLTVMSAILAFHRGRPVKLRVFCCLGLALMAGIFAQLFSPAPEAKGWELFPALWRNGGHGGGVLGGMIALGSAYIFSKIGAAILMAAGTGLLIYLAFRPQINGLAERARDRERPAYELQPERERKQRSQREPLRPKAEDTSVEDDIYAQLEASRLASSRKRRMIDIPVDDGPVPAEETDPAETNEVPPESRRNRGSLLRERAAGILTPDELLHRRREEAAAKAAAKAAEEAAAREAAEAAAAEAAAQAAEEEAARRAAEEEPFVMGANGLPLGGVSVPPAKPGDDPRAVPLHIPVEYDTTYTGSVPAAPVEQPAAVPPENQPQEKPAIEPPAETQPAPAASAKPAAPAKPAEEIQNMEEDIARAAALALEKAGPQGYAYPPVELLEQPKTTTGEDAGAELKASALRLIDTIRSFGIEVKLVNVTRGPSVTRYEMEMDRGVKLTKLTGLADDIALAMGATGVRIAPIPDKVAVVGVEVPNRSVSTVYLREIIESRPFQNSKSSVTFSVGKDIGGEAITCDIARMPHLLIAGTTGSGKSVCMNSLIISLLYRAKPEEVKLIMVDPKMVELSVYNGIPHLLIPVVTDPRKASGALQWAVSEMMRRYKSFAEHNVRNFGDFNALASRSGGELETMPQIVILLDELADLMMVAAKEVEESICRVAQMGRAAGMHLVIATQSPRADVITGIMKANIPSRIAFAVASQLESRIIMDTSGAEKLVGKGDMLYFPLGSGKPTRVQGCYVSSEEVERVVEFVKRSSEADYSDEVISQIEKNASGSGGGSSGEEEGSGELDEMFSAAVDVILEVGQASTSMLQRRLKLGYARAARLVDQLEAQGVVGPFEGAKPREIRITKEQWEEMKLQNPLYQ